MTKLNAVESEATWRQLPVGQQVHERYTALAKHVLQFEKQWFQGWRDNVDNAAMRYLKQPIFTRHGDTGMGMLQSLQAVNQCLTNAQQRINLQYVYSAAVACLPSQIEAGLMLCVAAYRQGCGQLPPRAACADR